MSDENDQPGSELGSQPQLCCVCPFCPKEWPCCFINRRTLRQHMNAPGIHEDEDSRTVHDGAIEWVTATKMVYQKKARWVRCDSAACRQDSLTLPMYAPSNFRCKSDFERATNFLERNQSHLENGAAAANFEIDCISANLRYFKDAVLLLHRVKKGTLECR